jgi:hypothetical protein
MNLNEPLVFNEATLDLVEACNEKSERKTSQLLDLTNCLADWLGLSDRTRLEHDKVTLKIPVGAMHWPAVFYRESNNLQDNAGSLTIDVSGLSLTMSFTLSHVTDLIAMQKLEQFNGGEDPHTNITVQELTLTPSDLRGLVGWLIQTIRPMEFLMQSV